jgi:DNA-binding PadR family transcriptional regulator
MVTQRASAALDKNPIEQLIIIEIGHDSIDTANAFVEYLHEIYSLSRSSVWYNLKKLKASGVLNFADRESRGKIGLSLTRKGTEVLRSAEPNRALLESRFTREELVPQPQVRLQYAQLY